MNLTYLLIINYNIDSLSKFHFETKLFTFTGICNINNIIKAHHYFQFNDQSFLSTKMYIGMLFPQIVILSSGDLNIYTDQLSFDTC